MKTKTKDRKKIKTKEMFHHILITSFNANSPPRNSYTSASRPNLLPIKYPNGKRREENDKQDYATYKSHRNINHNVDMTQDKWI